MAERQVLHMASPTHYANLMIRYMTAIKLRSFVPDLQISAIDLPYWNIHCPAIDKTSDDRTCRIVAEQHFAFNQIRYLFETGAFTRFDWFGYGQRLENFPSKQVCRDLFQAAEDVGMSTSEDHVVCPVRGGEILDAIHPGYTVVPVAFYRDIVEDTGLTPIFMGQTTDTPYMRSLRAEFPKAEFLPHLGVLDDFQTIRKARNVVLPVSTFAWLAAWLSDARMIVLPVFGLYNPKLFSLNDLLPLGETAYRFFQFPPQAAVPLAMIEQAHASIKSQWHEVPASDLVNATL